MTPVRKAAQYQLKRGSAPCLHGLSYRHIASAPERELSEEFTMNLRHVAFGMLGRAVVIGGLVIDTTLRWHFYSLWPTRAPVGIAFVVPLGVLIIIFALIAHVTPQSEARHKKSESHH